MKYIYTLILLLSFSAGVHSQSYIIGYEYWCDTSSSSRIYVSVPPQQQLQLDTMLGFAGISKGLHLMNIRFQQDNLYWSQTVSEYFFKTGEGISATGKITAYRYWVEDIDTVVTFHLSTPVNPYYLTVNLDLAWAHRGPNRLYIQFSDEADNWSVASVDSFYKSPTPIAAFTSNDTLICGNDSVHFQNTSNDADVFLWHFGDGDSSNAENPVHLYQQPGQYTVTLMVTDSTGLQDSTLTLVDYISINPAAHASFTFTQVGPNVTFINNSQNALSYAWHFGDSTISYLQSPVHTYPGDGNYTVILTAFDSCGSSSDTQFVSILLSADKIENKAGIDVFQTTGNLNIRFNSNLENCEYNLQTVTGQVVFVGRSTHISASQIETIPVSRFATGVYFLNISSSEGINRRKILIAN